jgi:hypothetical protein
MPTPRNSEMGERIMRRIHLTMIFVLAAGLVHAAPARAAAGSYVEAFGPLRFDGTAPPAARPRVSFLDAPAASDPQQAAPAPVAFEYSDGYRLRAKIHRLASWATLPLFGAEAYLGQKMFNNPAAATGGTRSAHMIIGTAIGGLFALNTVTGLWNMMEARKDPHGSTLRTVHGVLMLVADAGFFATAVLTRPNSRTANGLTVYDAKKNQHMTIAYASISTATVGYLIMLFGR